MGWRSKLQGKVIDVLTVSGTTHFTEVCEEGEAGRSPETIAAAVLDREAGEEAPDPAMDFECWTSSKGGRRNGGFGGAHRGEAK